MPLSNVVFLDMYERSLAEYMRLQNRLFDLTSQKLAVGNLPPELEAERTRLQAIFDTDWKPNDDGSIPLPIVPVRDPFYKTIEDTLRRITPPAVGDHTNGVLPSNMSTDPAVVGAGLTSSEIALAAVFGLMETDGYTFPITQGFLWPFVDVENHQYQRFIAAISTKMGEYIAHEELYQKVLGFVADEGIATVPRDGPFPSFFSSEFITAMLESQGILGRVSPVIQYSEVRASQWVQVVRILIAQGVTVDDALIALQTGNALSNTLGGGENAKPSSLSIELPDLDAQTDNQIVADNIRAMQAIYFAAMLEEVKMFQVVDKLVEQFQSGMLPLGRGNAGDGLYKYWKDSVNRMSEVERRNLYARTFGLSGGEPTVIANREFGDLWMRFISAVTSFVRQFTMEDLLRSTIPVPVTQEQVRKSALDVAGNLSLHGYGVAFYAATELQTQINQVIGLLSDPEVKNAYGARDMWQVIDQVATLELDGAKNSVRYRTMANSGAIIIRWLAERGQSLTGVSMTTVLDVNQVRNPTMSIRSNKPMVNPNDRDLVDACAQWLAVTGTQDQSVEEYAQPTETPNQTSRPIQIPQIARDMLSTVGISAGLSTTNGRNRYS